MDNRAAARDTLSMLPPGLSRRRVAEVLNSAYADGLLSENTFAHRLDELFASGLIDRAKLIGDLTVRTQPRALPTVLTRAGDAVRRLVDAAALREQTEAPQLLALDWSGGHEELLVGRHLACDVVLEDPTVSRRHARLRFRDGGWVLQDLESTNGTRVNDVRVIRCRLQPGDHLHLGEQQLQVD
ncbi:MAG: FHA domain-containing protein [Solirubrobacteraceae bacterium]